MWRYLRQYSIVLGNNPCVCKAQWDDSVFMESCANQQGCTDCAGEGRTWCHSTDYDCDEVVRNSNGDSEGWFWCESGTVTPTAGIPFKDERAHFVYNSRAPI